MSLLPSIPSSIRALLGRNGDAAATMAAALTSKALSVPTLREAQPDLQVELSRARRHQRPLALAILSAVQLPEEENGGAGRQAPSTDGRIRLETTTPQMASLLVATMLKGFLRQSDRVVYVPADDRFLVLLPETERVEAEHTVQRIEPVMRERVMVGLRSGIAAFPHDGSTLAELIEEARNQWRLRTPTGPSETQDRAARQGQGTKSGVTNDGSEG